MRRRAAVALAVILAIAAGHAAAQEPGSPLYFDATNYGFSLANPDNGPAVQAAHDAAAAALAKYTNVGTGSGTTRRRATVFLPGAPGIYRTKTPVFADANYIRFQGDGTTFLANVSGQGGNPVFIVGVPRVGAGKVPNSAYRPDLFGKLDATAAPSAGKRWGLRTNGDGYVVSQASSLSHGGLSPTFLKQNQNVPDAWTETRQLTIEAAAEGFAAGQLPALSVLAAIGKNANGNTPQPTPFGLYTSGGPNRFVLWLATTPARFGAPTSRSFTFTSAATGPLRIAVQIDLDAGAVTTLVNGVQVAVAGTLPAGLCLVENVDAPLVVNAANYGDNGPLGADFALYGLCLSRSIRYTTPGVGQVAARVDGKPITDLYRYFPTADDPNAIGFLGFTENPATAPRYLTVSGGGASGGTMPRQSGALLLNAHSNDLPTINSSFADLTVQGDVYGMPIQLGRVLATDFSDVMAQGGMYGIGNLPVGANYLVRLRRCTLQGTDAAYYGYFSTIQCDDLSIPYIGRNAFKLRGCNATVDHVFAGVQWGMTDSFASIYSQAYGGRYSFSDVTIDDEGGDPFKLALIYAEPAAYSRTSLHVNRIYGGAIGAAPLFMLRCQSGPNAVYPSATVNALDIAASTTGPTLDCDGMWTGTIRQAPTTAAIPMVPSVMLPSSTTGKSAVVVE